MKGTLERTVLVGAGLFAALLVAIAVLTYRNTSQLSEDARWVAHTNEVLDLTGEALLAVVDAETGQRGFLLTGRDEQEREVTGRGPGRSRDYSLERPGPKAIRDGEGSVDEIYNYRKRSRVGGASG